MKVTIVSPYKGAGNTVISTLIASTFARTQGEDVVLTYTSAQSKRICNYMGMEYHADITSSITQLYNLIVSDTVDPADCKDYMMSAGSNMYVLDTSSSSLVEEERVTLMKKVFDYNIAPVTICDMSNSLRMHKEPLDIEIINVSDVIIYNVTPDIKTLDEFKTWSDKRFVPKDKELLLLVNCYDERAYSTRALAQMFGFKPRNVYKIHRNPFIQKYSNEGKIPDLIQSILLRDIPVFELNQDLKEICQRLATSAKLRFKWES